MHHKKRLISAVFVVAAVLAAVASALDNAAAANTVFDGTVLSGYKYTTTTGDSFSLVSVPPRDKAVVDLPGESLIVENKSCSAGRMFQACYNGATFKGYNHSLADSEVYEFKITIGLVVPEVKVVKALDKAMIDVADSALVSVNITNVGTSQAAVRFTEAVPAQLKIIELPDQLCQLSANNTLKMEAVLKAGEIVRCSYKVNALAPGTYELASSASYDAVKRETATATATLTVLPLPLLLKEAVVEKLLLGESFNVSLELQSSSNLESFVFNAFIPEGIKVASAAKEVKDVTLDSSIPFERQKSGVEVIYGDLFTSLNGTVSISVLGEAVAVGASVISASSSWAYNGLEQVLIKDIFVNVTLARPYLRVARYDSEAGKLYMDVVNPAHLSIYNVTVLPATAAGVAAFSAGEVGSSGHASFSSAPGSSFVGYTGTIVYRTGYGQELSEPFSLSFNASKQAAATANETNKSAELPASQDSPNNSSQGEIVRKPKPQPKKLMPAEIRTAMIMVGIIILIIVIFFAIKGREKGFAEENGLG